MSDILKDRLTMLVSSCNAFSDLWDTHFLLLNRNWGDRGIKTLLVIDDATEKTFDGVNVISAGPGAELTQRFKYAMDYIDTDYVLITLDDYFLIHKIDTQVMEQLIEQMDRYELDYLRLFNRPGSHTRLGDTKSLYEVDLNSKMDTHYQINLYVGIWRKTFLEQSVQTTMNAWEYELSLTKLGRRIGAKCAMSKGKEFKILDAVRKGKLLHKSYRYLKKNHLYHGDRQVIKRKEELKLLVMKTIKTFSSQKTIDILKGVLRKKGFHFYSDDNQE